jgi:Methyltransferase domain
MPVLRVNNYPDYYRLRAQSKDIYALAGRYDKTSTTEFVNRKILEEIAPGQSDVLLDIGCGDASLLKMAHGRVLECIGTTTTPEEKARLESALPNLRFIVSTAQVLPLESGSVSKIVCNSVLLLIQDESDVRTALREMVRVARTDATIWVGEIPTRDEVEYYGQYRGNSMLGFLWHLLRHQGLRAFFGMIRRWLKAVIGTEQIILNSARGFCLEPEKMIALARDCGLLLTTYSRHKELDPAGNIADSEFRYDYVFTRSEAIPLPQNATDARFQSKAPVRAIMTSLSRTHRHSG